MTDEENAELKAKLKGFENGDVAWQGDMDKTIKQNLELKEQIENYKLSENESKEIIAELKSKLEKEQNLNKVIKERLVEVNCDCNAEKKEKCVMFPEYCEGERKTVVDLMSLVSDGLNESLIKQKEEQIDLLSQRILEQQKTIGSLTDTIDKLKAQIGKMQNVGNCKHAMDCAKFNEKELIYGKLRTCKNCKDWELAE